MTLSEHIWNQTVDLVFDCIYQAVCLPKRSLMEQKITETSKALIVLVRKDLLGMTMDFGSFPYFRTAQKMLGELALFFQISQAMGELQESSYHQLSKQIVLLRRLLKKACLLEAV